MAAVDPLREQLIRIIDGHDAHLPFDTAVADFPAEAVNRLTLLDVLDRQDDRDAHERLHDLLELVGARQLPRRVNLLDRAVRGQSQIDVDNVATQRVFPLIGMRRIFKRPPVVGVFVMIQDVFFVDILFA